MWGFWLLLVVVVLPYLIFQIHTGRTLNWFIFRDEITERNNPVFYWINVASGVGIVLVILALTIWGK